MTRGQKRCYVYCTDKELGEYLEARIRRVYEEQLEVKTYLVAEDGVEYE